MGEEGGADERNVGECRPVGVAGMEWVLGAWQCSWERWVGVAELKLMPQGVWSTHSHAAGGGSFAPVFHALPTQEPMSCGAKKSPKSMCNAIIIGEYVYSKFSHTTLSMIECRYVTVNTLRVMIQSFTVSYCN